MNIVNYGLHEKYNEFAVYGDRLSEMDKQVDYELLGSIFDDLYRNDTHKGGRPSINPQLG